MALTTDLTVNLRFNHTKTVGGKVGKFDPDFTFVDGLTDGVAVDKADVLWFAESRSLNATTSEELDLAGSLTDAFGTTFTAAKVKCIYIRNRGTAVDHILEIGGAAANAFPLFKDVSDIYECGPNGIFLIWEPALAAHAVTAGTGDKLKINNTGSTSLTYDIAIAGASA